MTTTTDIRAETNSCRRGRGGALGAFVAVAALATILLTACMTPPQESAEPQESLASECFGIAAAISGPEECPPATEIDQLSPAPAPEAAAKDSPKLPRELCPSIGPDVTELPDCFVGDQSSDIRIALAGDSHAGHYSGVMQQLAEANGWALDIYAKGQCPASRTIRILEPEQSANCAEWNESLLERLTTGDYDVIVTSQASGVDYGTSGDETSDQLAVRGLVEEWTAIADAGTSIVAITDNPRPVAKVLTCIADYGPAAPECRNPLDKALLYDPQPEAVALVDDPRVQILDMTDQYCDDTACNAVIGSVIVNRDANHLTNTFAGTLGPQISQAIQGQLSRDR